MWREISLASCPIFSFYPFIHLSIEQEPESRSPTHLPQARDLLRDTSQARGNFEKPGDEGQRQSPSRFKFRAMEACWQIQTLTSKEGDLGKERTSESEKMERE